MSLAASAYQRIRQQNATLRMLYANNNVEVVNSYPQTIQILPSLRCNYRCKMCFVNEEELKNGKEINFAALEKLDPIFPFVESIYLTGGEPLLYSRFNNLASMAGQHDCKVNISTNGSLILKRFESIVKYVHELKVSIDAATPETYKGIRIGGNFEKVIKSLLEVTKWKIKNRSPYPILRFSFVSMYSNVHELPDLIRLSKDIGVETVAAQYMGNKKGKEHLIEESLFYHKDYSDKYFMEAMALANDLGIQFTCRGLFNEKKEKECNARFTKSTICSEPWRYMVISSDGRVTPCCPGPMFMGNINDQSFDEIWNNDKYRYLRKRINTDNEPKECAKCTNCKVDMSRERTFVGAA